MAKTRRGNLPTSEAAVCAEKEKGGPYDICRVARSLPAVLLSKDCHPSPWGSHHALAPRHTG